MSNRWRVRHGWSAYEDFPTLKEAEDFAKALATKPCKDPLCREVVVLDKHQRVAHEAGGSGVFRTLAKYTRRPCDRLGMVG